MLKKFTNEMYDFKKKVTADDIELQATMDAFQECLETV